VADCGTADKTGLSLIYSNRTPYDIILDEDLTEFEKEGKLCYVPLVQNPDENWVLGSGRVTEDMIRSYMPEAFQENDESLIIVCGPPKLKEAVKGILDEMEWKNYFIFN